MSSLKRASKTDSNKTTSWLSSHNHNDKRITTK